MLESLNDSTKWAVSAAAFATLVARRDLSCAWCILGSILAAANCRALKFLLNEARPPSARKADPGMPSSHANSLAFLSTYVAVAAAAPSAAAAAAVPPVSATTALLVVGTPVVGIFLAWLRVALGYHSLPQVAVGWAVGATSAALWWSAGRWAVLPAASGSPALAAGVYIFAAAAMTFFSLKHVARWAAERAPSGGGAVAT